MSTRSARSSQAAGENQPAAPTSTIPMLYYALRTMELPFAHAHATAGAMLGPLGHVLSWRTQTKQAEQLEQQLERQERAHDEHEQHACKAQRLIWRVAWEVSCKLARPEHQLHPNVLYVPTYRSCVPRKDTTSGHFGCMSRRATDAPIAAAGPCNRPRPETRVFLGVPASRMIRPCCWPFFRTVGQIVYFALQIPYPCPCASSPAQPPHPLNPDQPIFCLHQLSCSLPPDSFRITSHVACTGQYCRCHITGR